MLITKPVGNFFSSLATHSPSSQVSPLAQSVSVSQAGSSSETQLPSWQISPLEQSSSIVHSAVMQLEQSTPPQSTSSSSSSSILLSHISIVSVTLTSGVTIPETNIFSKSFPCKAIKAIEVSLTLLPQCPSAVATLCK